MAPTSSTDAQTIQAFVLEGDPPTLHSEELRVDPPRAAEVLVEVAACGVCHTDLHVMKTEVIFPPTCGVGARDFRQRESSRRGRRPRQPGRSRRV